MKILTLLLLSTLGLSSFAGEQDDVITKNAVIFEGKDFSNNSCNLAVSMTHENGEHIFLTKVEYSVHGENLPANESNFYRFDRSTKTYNDVQTGNGKIVLAGAVLNDETEADLNQLNAYKASGNFKYSLLVNLNPTSPEDFEEALEEVIEDPTQLAAFASSLDVAGSLGGETAHCHGGHHCHYDRFACRITGNLKVEEVEFEIGDHDDHDHGHGHNH